MRIVLSLLFCPVLVCVAAEPQRPTVLQVPGTWEDQADGRFAGYDGYAWYRCYVRVPAKWTEYREDIEEFSGSKNLWSQSVSILTKRVADVHAIYVNGKKIGTTGGFPPDFRSGYEDYQRWKVPAGLLEKDRYNVIAIRVYNREGPGGFRGEAPVITGYFTECTLAGPWEFRTGDDEAWAAAAVAEKPDAAVYEKFVLSRSQLNRPAKLIRGKKLAPAESMRRMTVSPDLELDQVLTEPRVAQPVSMTFDARGRLWVVQYRQYPYPAGMTITSRDKYYRAVYDKISPPPPDHFRGMDRITIHEDTDGDGVFDRHKRFRDDLNMAVSVAHGRGGIWVMNPPYLLFYPDADGDDVPDADPQVRLEGLGMQDTHSVPNSLRWGPDGWLYFVQGSTVSSNVRTPEMDPDDAIYCEAKATWRYHPESRRIELFTEGGYNAFGFDFDSQGRLFCGQNVGNARAVHNVQGAYYPKGGPNKYGPPSNPYTFGTLDTMRHSPPTPRFNHTVVRYEDRGLPERFRGRLVSVDPLHQNAYLTELIPRGSTFETKDVEEPLASTDIGFRPVDLRIGPDGAIYIGDFYEEFIAHGQHYQGQIDPSTGRIYRLRADGEYRFPQIDLTSTSSGQLVDLLSHPSKWYRQTALRLLGDRRDAEIVPRLKEMVETHTEQLALHALWALNLSGGFDESVARGSLRHPNPHVRRWTVRLLGDAREVSAAMAESLAELAAGESDAEVRAQLACSARRLPAEQSLAIVRALARHDGDVDDPHLPLLLWWAVEDKAADFRQQVLGLFAEEAFRTQPVVVEHLLERIMKRYALEGGRSNLQACASLLREVREPKGRERLLAGFEDAYRGRPLSDIPESLARQLAAAGGGSPVLRMRMGDRDAIDAALVQVAETGGDRKSLRETVAVLGELREPRVLDPLLARLKKTDHAELQKTILNALLNFAEPAIADAVLDRYPEFGSDVRQVARTLLVSRPAWSRALLKAVDAGRLDSEELATDTVRKMLIHGDPKITELVERHWSGLGDPSDAELRQRIADVRQILEAGAGDLYRGREVFMETCAKCHVLFSDGQRVGPELTQYKRDDRLRMLMNVVNPSAEIREGYENYLVLDRDGRVTTGFLVDQDEHVVVLRGGDGQDITVPRDEIEEMVRQRESLMPEGLLDKLSDQAIRDLFAYLQVGQPLIK